MKLRTIIPFLLMVLLIACGKTESGSEGEWEPIPRKDFVDLLAELYLLEGEVQYRRNNFGIPADSAYPKGTRQVLEEFGTDRERFERSYHHYMKDTEKMEAIHEDVVSELMRRKGKRK